MAVVIASISNMNSILIIHINIICIIIWCFIGVLFVVILVLALVELVLSISVLQTVVVSLVLVVAVVLVVVILDCLRNLLKYWNGIKFTALLYSFSDNISVLTISSDNVLTCSSIIR